MAPFKQFYEHYSTPQISKYTICVYSFLDPPTNGNEEQEKSCVLDLSLSPVGRRVGGGGCLVGLQASICKNEDHEFSLYLFMNKVRKILKTTLLYM